MKVWKTIALAAVLAGAAGLGAALAPGASAQSKPYVTVTPRPEVAWLGGGSRLGVSVRDVEASDKTKATGVVIDEVDENSAASKAGLKVGDVVVEFDGERVRSVRQFARLVSETPEGRTVQAAVMRDGARVSMSVTPEGDRAFRFFNGESWTALDNTMRRFETVPTPRPPALPSRPALPTTPRAAPLPPTFERFFWTSGNQLGITATQLEPQLAEYFGTKQGVLVSSVSPDSAAAKAGLKAGDVITSLNGTAVDDPSSLRSHLRDLEGGEFTLSIVRDKKPMTLKGKVEPPAERRRTVTRTIL